ncbi:hypothetical protein [Amycolatopsis thermoflava]|uniref:hypothetical protein n=1 Tax=Amycolatopsis thermoflava TaxID=84480 RepID=UPI003815947F
MTPRPPAAGQARAWLDRAAQQLDAYADEVQHLPFEHIDSAATLGVGYALLALVEQLRDGDRGQQ